MNAMTTQAASQTLEAVVQRVIDDAEPTILISDTGEQVIMVPLDEYRSWQETLYLLASRANAAHLARSLNEAEGGQVYERALFDDDDA